VGGVGEVEDGREDDGDNRCETEDRDDGEDGSTCRDSKKMKTTTAAGSTI